MGQVTSDLFLRTIPFGKNGEVVKLDRINGTYRTAWYHEIVNHSGKRERVRDTATALTLEDTLLGLFNTPVLSPDARDLLFYIRTTEWGENLP